MGSGAGGNCSGSPQGCRVPAAGARCCSRAALQDLHGTAAPGQCSNAAPGQRITQGSPQLVKLPGTRNRPLRIDCFLKTNLKCLTQEQHAYFSSQGWDNNNTLRNALGNHSCSWELAGCRHPACAHSCSAVLSILPGLKPRGRVLPARTDIPPLESNKMKISLRKGEAARFIRIVVSKLETYSCGE